MATATLFHPILMLIPQRWYSIKDGKILNACLYYSWSYFQNSIVYLVDIKYLLIGLERNIVMRNRHTYEKRDGSDAKRLLIRAVSTNYTVYLFVYALGYFVHDRHRAQGHLRILLYAQFTMGRATPTYIQRRSLGAFNFDDCQLGHCFLFLRSLRKLLIIIYF
jgi:hypothetical protein